jgi:hypothetical protein
MNPSELESIWKRQGALEPSPENIIQIADALHSADRKFRRTIWWRDVRETVAALFCAGFFGFVGQTWLRWIAVASGLFVAAYIVKSRIAVRFRPEGLSLADRLQQMILETEMQIGLLRSVLWWYLLPIAVGIIAMVLDRAAASPRKFDPFHLTNFLVIMSVLGVVVYWLNQRAVRKILEPRRSRLEQTLSDLQSPA